MGIKIFEKLNSLLNRSEDNLHNKIISSGIWVAMSNISIRVLSTLRTIILARLLSPTIFGLMGIVNLIVDGLETFTQTGFTSALIYYQKDVKEIADVAWTLNIVRGFILSIIVYLLAPIVARFYSQPILESLIKVISIIFIIKGFININMVFFRKDLDFKKVVILEQSSYFLGFIVTIFLAYYLRNVWALIWGVVTFFVFDNLLSYIVQPIRPRLKFNKRLALNVFNYGMFITGANIISFLTTEADDALVGKLLGMENLGYYVIGYSLARLPLEINKVVSSIMFPAYSHLQNQHERLKKLFLKTVNFVAILSVPAACGLFVLASPIVKVLYGEKWMPAAPVIRILSIYGALWALQATTLSFFNGLGRPKYNFYSGIVKLLTLLLSLYYFTYRFKLPGACIAVVASEISTLALSIYYMKGFGIKLIDVIQAVLKPLLVSFFMAISVALLKTKINSENLASLILLVVAGVVINFSGLYIVYLKKMRNTEIKLDETT